MKSHDKFHEKQLKSSMEKGLQKKADMLYCLLCGYSPYSEVGNAVPSLNMRRLPAGLR